MRGICTKNGAISQLGAEKITVPLNLTDRQTYIRTDISVYRVASLLKSYNRVIKWLKEISKNISMKTDVI